jgi:hypothetical protein
MKKTTLKRGVNNHPVTLNFYKPSIYRTSETPTIQTSTQRIYQTEERIFGRQPSRVRQTNWPFRVVSIFLSQFTFFFSFFLAMSRTNNRRRTFAIPAESPQSSALVEPSKPSKVTRETTRDKNTTRYARR